MIRLDIYKSPCIKKEFRRRNRRVRNWDGLLLSCDSPLNL